ncbi:hypothetical protein K3G63_14220 [Hymenobacter sp. HSC-4F20]|uniref:hypothetical protein n=1 Tax=Hymenobacter sp. HSC-4F20 TaxID=2864135 RepID=UPI001C730D69|nr:hypothetical protein [Hymenobacter sp. HSC-4F20]MBX0291602.1 hypothetical protein [Hymenobacter sp. HSC-4F20]
MQVHRWYRYWAVIGLLATGCRSEKVAFQFRPTAQPGTQVSVVEAGPEVVAASPEDTAPLAVGKPAASSVLGAPSPVSIVAKSAQAAARLPRKASLLVRQVAARKHQRQEVAARTRPRQLARHDTFHLILGGLLIAAGVVSGILLGGWLGLGVGAVIVILGYYFVVLGIGGQHAWLEIFQEFFNM